MNIYDIAKKAGVSPATVSRVINNKPNISDRTYQKVQAVLKENNYIPNAIARGLVSNSMNLIGIIVDDIRNLYRSHIIYELSQLLNQHRYNTIIFDFGNQDNDLFNSLTPEQQEILVSTCEEAGVYNNELQQQSEQEYLQKMKDEGVTVVEPTEECWKASVRRRSRSTSRASCLAGATACIRPSARQWVSKTV